MGPFLGLGHLCLCDLRFASLLPETPADGAGIAAERLRTLIPDVTTQFEFPFTVSVAHMGWGEAGAPEIDEVIARVIGPFGDLRE